jgi:hypothetical protein
MVDYESKLLRKEQKKNWEHTKEADAKSQYA